MFTASILDVVVYLCDAGVKEGTDCGGRNGLIAITHTSFPT